MKANVKEASKKVEKQKELVIQLDEAQQTIE